MLLCDPEPYVIRKLQYRRNYFEGGGMAMIIPLWVWSHSGVHLPLASEVSWVKTEHQEGWSLILPLWAALCVCSVMQREEKKAMGRGGSWTPVAHVPGGHWLNCPNFCTCTEPSIAGCKKTGYPIRHHSMPLPQIDSRSWGHALPWSVGPKSQGVLASTKIGDAVLSASFPPV